MFICNERALLLTNNENKHREHTTSPNFSLMSASLTSKDKFHYCRCLYP